MKTFRLLIVALLVTATAAAQNRMSGGDEAYSPTVYLISAHQVEAIDDCDAVKEAAELNKMAVQNAIQDYEDTHRMGFQQTDKPMFIMASKNNRFSLAIGGYVNLRAGYDFDGISDNLDFLPSAIPVPGDFNSHQKLMMDATTSRLYLKMIGNTRALGRVVVYIDGDFRGGNPNSYTPRLRSAYVSFLGLTLGRDVSTFCDLSAAPTTIDFQGPNAYNFNFATMIRYEVSFIRNHFTFGVAAEMPSVSATYGNNFEPMHQRVPDVPMYLQYAWGANRDSHIRVSGVFRDMYLYKVGNDAITDRLGWGAQFSGTIKVCKGLQLFMNGVYGEGITPYIQDLSGLGLDITPNPDNMDQLQTMPMWGWQAAAQINLSRRVFVSGGYSEVRVETKNGYFANDEYRRGQYIFGNIFCKITPRFKVAAEYLYGTRKNMDEMMNHANRVNLMAQYSF